MLTDTTTTDIDCNNLLSDNLVLTKHDHTKSLKQMDAVTFEAWAHIFNILAIIFSIDLIIRPSLLGYTYLEYVYIVINTLVVSTDPQCWPNRLRSLRYYLLLSYVQLRTKCHYSVSNSVSNNK